MVNRQQLIYYLNNQGSSGTGTHRNTVPVRRSGSFYDVERCYLLLFNTFSEVRIGLINGSRFCQNIENVCRVCRAVHTLT